MFTQKYLGKQGWIKNIGGWSLNDLNENISLEKMIQMQIQIETSQLYSEVCEGYLESKYKQSPNGIQNHLKMID